MRRASARLDIVRHAVAVARSDFRGHDLERPLDKRGLRQARAIAERLSSPPPWRILTSPATRCIATIASLAHRVGVEPELEMALAEGADPATTLEVLLAILQTSARESGTTRLVACTHGDVVHGILESADLASAGLRPPLRAPKGSTWRLSVQAGVVVSARRLPAPR